MAKAAAKTTSTAKKAVTTKPKTTVKTSADPIQKISEDTLKKLQGLGIEQQLQADLEWCMGSYSHDKNPSGVLEMLNKSCMVLKHEQAKKTKGVTSKLISDLEKILKAGL
jgi:hypothetical protein